MSKIAEIDEKIKIERMKLNLADTPEAKAKVQRQIVILNFRREIEHIRDQITKLT
jgi:hypothetical protein